MNKNTKYPFLIAEPISKSKKKKVLLLFNQRDSSGYEIKGNASDICVMFSGKRTLETIVQEFKELNPNVQYDIDSEIEKMITILEELKLIEFLDSPIK